MHTETRIIMHGLSTVHETKQMKPKHKMNIYAATHMAHFLASSSVRSRPSLRVEVLGYALNLLHYFLRSSTEYGVLGNAYPGC